MPETVREAVGAETASPTFTNREAAAIFTQCFRRLGWREQPEFFVEFRPYAGLKGKIRGAGPTCFQVMLSDVMASAPREVLEAVAEILVMRYLGMDPGPEAVERYKAWAMHPVTRRRGDEARRRHGWKSMLPAKGRHWDLDAILDDLNGRFFEGKVPRPRIGWSPSRALRRLGHYDSSHHTITISRWFDSPTVPRCLVEYLVYHEMLHIRFPVERRGSRAVVHSAEFRKAERAFPEFKAALRHLRAMTAATYDSF